MARSFAERVAPIAIGSTHLILFILSILSGRILSCTPQLDGLANDLAPGFAPCIIPAAAGG